MSYLAVQLKILQILNYTLISHLYKKIKFMDYNYTTRPSKQKFTVFILYSIYVFKASFFIILLHFLSLKNIYLSIKKISFLLKTFFHIY